MALKTVANINNTTAYGSIENALNAAVSGNTVWVIPDATGNVVIKADVTIKANVVLLIPYGTTDDANGRNKSSKSTVTEKTRDNLVCMNKVTLAEGKTINNYGTIEISGVLSGGGGGAAYSGHTAGNYATLQLSKNSKIISESGSNILCYGFIEETASNNGSSVVINNGATLKQPMTLRDFRGGSYFKVINDNLPGDFSPFNQMVFINVAPELRINYGGVMRVWANLYASSSHHSTEAIVIGHDSSAVLQLLDENYSYLVAKLKNKAFNPGTANAFTDTVSEIKIYGGAKTNGMELSVVGKKINTQSGYFPISYFFDITLCNSGSGESIYYMNQAFKFLTGSKLTVEQGVVLQIENKAIFYEEYVDECQVSGINIWYPKQLKNNSAELNVYGNVIAKGFGGIINVLSPSARVFITSAASCTAFELKNYSGSVFSAELSDTQTIRHSAKIRYGMDGSLVDLANNGYGIGGYCVENSQISPIFIILDTDGGTALDPVHIKDTDNIYPTLPTPIRDGFVFVDWYFGDTIVKQGDALHSAYTHTLKATWKPGIGISLNTNGGECTSTSSEAIDQNGVWVYDTLPTPTKFEHKFLGWFYGEEQVNSGDVLKISSSHELVAKWEINTYTVTLSTSNATVTGVTDGQSIAYGTTVTITLTFSADSNKTFEIKDSTGNVFYSNSTEGEHTFTMPASNITITATSSAGSCVTPDTLITLADGTQVRVDSLTGDELLLVWNMNTGSFDSAPIMFIDSEAETEVEIIRLCFSDGTVVKVISEHGFWDYDLNKYVYLDRYADKYIGHTFAKQNGDSLEKVQLVDVVLTTEVSTAWSPVTVEHLCYVVNGMLSMPGGVGGLFNIFEVDAETMTYDFEAMEKDIEAYGLYTYEELNAICPLTEDMFYAAGGAYLKISIAKGNLTEEELFAMINRYSKFV